MYKDRLHRISLTLAAVALVISPAFSAEPSSTSPDGTAQGRSQCPVWHGGTGTGLSAFAAGGAWWPGLDTLQPTPEQRDAIRKIGEKYRTRGWELAQRAAGIREQFTRVAPDDPDYADATQKASETAASLASDIVKMAAQARADVEAVLTDEQRARLRERLNASQKRWDEWRSQHRAPQ